MTTADTVYWWLHEYISCHFCATNYFHLRQVLCPTSHQILATPLDFYYAGFLAHNKYSMSYRIVKRDARAEYRWMQTVDGELGDFICGQCLMSSRVGSLTAGRIYYTQTGVAAFVTPRNSCLGAFRQLACMH